MLDSNERLLPSPKQANNENISVLIRHTNTQNIIIDALSYKINLQHYFPS